MGYMEKYNEWRNNPFFDEETKKQLEAMKDDKKEIEDSFYKELEFGTAGLRGIVGAGTNRMNKYTVGKVTQGLANYIIKKGGEARGLAIAYDSRHYSEEFSKQVALILNANGIKTYLFESLRPTPELSFAIRYLNCISGIVITASHNPPKYNGYKVYWEDGAQVSEPIDVEITEEVNAVSDYSAVKTITEEQAASKGLYNIIGKEIDDEYIDRLKKLSLNPDIIKKMSDDIKIVYTPLHGTGGDLAKRVLTELGFKNVYMQKEQSIPDGDFPTVEYPNPEDPKSFKLAEKLAKEVDADIILANDPDADRIGLFVKDSKTGEYVIFNGNMLGLMIAEYLITERRIKGLLPKNSSLIKTIVSSNMTDSICKENGVALFEVLTGFKNIAAKIKSFEENDSYKCIMGYEESYGCLVGDHARDKDGIIAVMLLCEAAAFYKNQGLTLWDQMLRMYDKYGYYKEENIQVTLEGVDGATKIKEMMENLRRNTISKIGGYKVCRIKDYSNGQIRDLVKNETYSEDLPKSNVMYYELEDDAWIAARPSGTEPKIKFYVGIKGTSLENANEKLEKVSAEIKEIAKS
jgi:phosphoglucomutase